MIKGSIPMTYCFFNRNNTIDIKLMSDQISLIKQLGSNGIACLGLATEVNKLEFSEKEKSYWLRKEKNTGSMDKQF